MVAQCVVVISQCRIHEAHRVFMMRYDHNVVVITKQMAGSHFSIKYTHWLERPPQLSRIL